MAIITSKDLSANQRTNYSTWDFSFSNRREEPAWCFYKLGLAHPTGDVPMQWRSCQTVSVFSRSESVYIGSMYFSQMHKTKAMGDDNLAAVGTVRYFGFNLGRSSLCLN